MPLLLEWRKEKHFSCVCVVETVSLLLLLLLLLSLFLCSFLLPSDYNFFGLLLVQWELPPRVPIVGVPATSGGRCVLEEGEWRVLMRAGILFGEVVVVAVGVMVVAAVRVMSFAYCFS